MLPTYQISWRLHLAKNEETASKLTERKTSENIGIRNEHEEYILQQEDVRRWQMAGGPTDRTPAQK